ncbi:MAG: elongation factor G [Planctomycetota bacterium]|jgi:elongation factor G
MDTSVLRNIAFVGHPFSGKTTLVDALAFEMGASDRKGSVADKTSICDTEPEEQEKHHTLLSKVVHAEWEDHSWNLFDTPGYPDFVGETQSAIFASDLVVGVVSCTSGVTFNLTKKMETAADLGCGRALVITHLDGELADFDTIVEELRAKIGEMCVPIQVPNASGPGFTGSERVFLKDPETSVWRQTLMDAVMDTCQDEPLLASYLEGQRLTEEQLEIHLPHAIATGSVVPILVCNPASGAALLEFTSFLTRFAPCPNNASHFQAEGETISPDPDGDFMGVVVAVRSDAHVGKLSTMRVLRGQINATDQVWSGEDGKPEKLGGLFHLVGGKRRDPIESAGPGEIVAFSKVEHLGFGDVVVLAGQPGCDLEEPVLSDPMVALAAVPKTRADEQKIGAALHKLEAEDPTFLVEHVAETHELVMHGMSDLHLQIIEARLKRRFGVEIETSLPKIPFQETIVGKAEAHYRHKKQSGGRGQFGECSLRIKPGASGSGVVFVDKVVGGAIPRNLIPAVEKGILELCGKGVLTHSRVVDVEAEVFDGKFHAVDSDEASFKRAGAGAFIEAFMKARPVLMEPLMEMEIHVPTGDAGTIFSDLTSHRRGHVTDQSVEAGGHVTVITAQVPLAMVQTYHRDLKSQTSGEGFYTMKLIRYAPMPAAEQQKILKTEGRKHEE